MNLCSNVTFSMRSILITLFSIITHACTYIPNPPYIAFPPPGSYHFLTHYVFYFFIMFTVYLPTKEGIFV